MTLRLPSSRRWSRKEAIPSGMHVCCVCLRSLMAPLLRGYQSSAASGYGVTFTVQDHLVARETGSPSSAGSTRRIAAFPSAVLARTGSSALPKWSGRMKRREILIGLAALAARNSGLGTNRCTPADRGLRRLGVSQINNPPRTQAPETLKAQTVPPSAFGFQVVANPFPSNAAILFLVWPPIVVNWPPA